MEKFKAKKCTVKKKDAKYRKGGREPRPFVSNSKNKRFRVHVRSATLKTRNDSFFMIFRVHLRALKKTEFWKTKT